jgi:predicted AAA+ superfamily ATPase
VLLSQVADDKRSRRPGATVAELNFELADLAFVTGPEQLERLVLERLGDTRHQVGYAILDEVQLVPGFEAAVNSPRARGGVSVFVSGSNASLFSDELATRLAGRYVENLGRTLSPSSLVRYLAGRGRKIAADTIYSYLRALTGALLFNQVRRFDIRGKDVLARLDKYYATDLGIVASKHVGTGPGSGDVLENAVFAELAKRGFEVFAGRAATREIDFVAVRDGTPRYVQVAYLLATPVVVEREFGAFAAIRDSYPRFVISADPLTSDRDGIRHLSLEEFLVFPPPELA